MGIFPFTIWLFNLAMERSTIFKFAKAGSWTIGSRSSNWLPMISHEIDSGYD